MTGSAVGFLGCSGYTYVADAEAQQGLGSLEPKEHRLHAALSAKAGLPNAVMLEGLVRVDLRRIDGEPSARRRFTLEVNREFSLAEHVVTPHGQVEALHETRHDAWSRRLLQAGVDNGWNESFRLELYLARQSNRVPSESTVSAFGIVARVCR